MQHEIENLKLKMIKWSIFTIIILVMGNLFDIRFFIIIGIFSLIWCIILFATFVYLTIRHFYD